MKKIIITGAGGFIGNNLVEFYIKKGYSVHAFFKNNTKIPSNNCKSYFSDLEIDDNTKLYKDIEPDIFIHCAGSASVLESVKNSQNDFDKNVKVLYKTLTNINNAQISPKIIFLSSAAVYGNPLSLPIQEEDNLNPISPYGFHKKMCEDICQYYVNKGLDIKVLRIFSAYGQGLKRQILWDMFNKIKQYNKLELYGTGDESRDFIHIDDIVNSLDIILNSKCKDVVYNIGNGIEIKIKDLAKRFVQTLGLNKNIITFNNINKTGDPTNWKADITKLTKLGYKQNISIEEGIDRYIKWVRSIKNE